jgi:hypothetical protein
MHVGPEYPDADRRFLENSDVAAMWRLQMAEAFRQAGAGPAADLRVISRAWGFSPADIAVPNGVSFWHGEDDPLIPVGHSRYLSETVPRARLTVAHGEGHLSMFQMMPAIITELLGRTT